MSLLQLLATGMGAMVMSESRRFDAIDQRWIGSAVNNHEVRAKNTLSQKGLRKRKRQMIGRGVK